MYLLGPCLLLLGLPSVVWSHGRLIEPPSRASAWRYGFQTPPNYNDHELYCGGFTRQQQNGGKCGVCGDAFDIPPPRPHEFGGVFGQGVIVRRYPRNGLITIRIELTANHNGHFEFRVCDDYRNTTQECLDKNLLKLYNIKRNELNDALGYRYFPKEGNKIYEMRYRLPNLQCRHCVLQWKYIAGNNWGLCPNGTGAVGCGSQEEFRACADISIGKGATEVPTTTTPPPTTVSIPVEETVGQKPSLSVLFIILGALLLVLGALSILYFHFYNVGDKLKRLIKFRKKDKQQIPPPPKFDAPLPPPRVKRGPVSHPGPHLYGNRMYNVSLESVA